MPCTRHESRFFKQLTLRARRDVFIGLEMSTRRGPRARTMTSAAFSKQDSTVSQHKHAHADACVEHRRLAVHRDRLTAVHVGQVRADSARGALLDVGNGAATAINSISKTRSARGGMLGGTPFVP